MRKAIYCCAVLAFFSISACVDETYPNQDITGEVQTVTVIGPETIGFEPITGNPPTKGTSVDNGTALNFNWVVGDTLGIFPNKGNQVEFPISSSEGSSASFDGGGWALRNESSYAAYYPFSVWNYHRDNEKIMLDYSGQVQDGNGSFSHLSAYDFLASVQTTPLNGSVTFNMERQGSILYIDIVVPEPETITSLVVSCDEAIFVEKAYLDISGSSPVVTPVETVETLTLSFINTVTTTANETVRAYMAVHPLDFSDKVVTATLVTESGSYTAPVTSRIVNKGKAAFLRFSDDFTPVNIEFADAEVKRICVENWDTNGDGELSYKEAAAVTDLGQVFKSNNTITTFNELEYFTGLTEIANSAFYCSSLTSVVIPENVTVIRDDAFRYAYYISNVIFLGDLKVICCNAFCACYCLKEIDLPDALEEIELLAFQCSALEYIRIPDNVKSLGEGLFWGCKNLRYFTGKYVSSDGKSLVKDSELYAIAPVGITDYIVPSGVSIIKTASICSEELINLIVPDGVLEIEGKSIDECPNLSTVSLPSSLNVVGGNNFNYCENLRCFSGKFASSDGRCLITDGVLMAFAPAGLAEYIMPDGISEVSNFAFLYKPSIVSVTFPESLEFIGYHSFYNNSSLLELRIPANVKTIEDGAFCFCRSLERITVNIVTPFAIGDSVFDETNNCPIYVPNESVEAYKTTEGWSDYADRIFGIEVEGSVVGPGTENPE